MPGFEQFARLVEDGTLVMPKVVGSKTGMIILVFFCRFQTSSFTDPHGNVASLFARLRVSFSFRCPITDCGLTEVSITGYQRPQRVSISSIFMIS